MEVRSKYESALILDKIEIIESSFRKKDGSLDDLELGVQVDHSLNKIGDDKFELILTTKVADQDEKVCDLGKRKSNIQYSAGKHEYS